MAEGDEARRERLAALGRLLDLAEDLTEMDLCWKFKAISEPLFSETPEFRLARVLVEAPEPLELPEIAAKCGARGRLRRSDRRVERAIERLEKEGLVLNVGGEGRPRYRLDRENVTAQLLGKLYSRRGPAVP